MIINDWGSWYKYIVNLYLNSASDDTFIIKYNDLLKLVKDGYIKDDSKMKINSLDDLSIVIKAKFCIEIPLATIGTPYKNAHYIAGEISKRILLGEYMYKSLTAKQKDMFVKSMNVDFSNIEQFDLRKVSDPIFVKDPNITFY